MYQPWADTPVQWRRGGCAGSSPERRGYPCSLWTLFHTLLASSLDKVTVCITIMTRVTCHVQDPAWSRGATSTVARAMVGYISLLFSCRDCAANFQVKIFLLHRKYFSPAAPGPREHGGVPPGHAGPEPAVAVGHPQHRQPRAGRGPHRGDTHHYP